MISLTINQRMWQKPALGIGRGPDTNWGHQDRSVGYNSTN